jgi:dihydrofolate synthase/folylpolyglutamate synthase
MLHACLSAAGYRTGRYTSPHLVNWRERTVVDADPISPTEVLALEPMVRRAVESLPPDLGPLTTFEVGTAFSLLHFASRHIDVAVVEVGTGGRFDATNLVDPVVSVITPVSYDHTQTLGETLTSIAWHKAGIMRSGRPAISSPQTDEAQRTLEDEAHKLGAALEFVGREWRWSSSGSQIRIQSSRPEFVPLDVEVGLIGDHQRDNATAAVAALHAVRDRFDVPPHAVRTALSTVEWPGRLQVLSRDPLLVLDGAHNAASADVLRHALERWFTFERLLLVVGLTEGKDAPGVLSPLVPTASAVYLARSQHERSAASDQLEPLVRGMTQVPLAVFAHADKAVQAALKDARPQDLVLVTGSLFLVGEVLDWWRRSHP